MFAPRRGGRDQRAVRWRERGGITIYQLLETSDSREIEEDRLEEIRSSRLRPLARAGGARPGRATGSIRSSHRRPTPEPMTAGASPSVDELLAAAGLDPSRGVQMVAAGRLPARRLRPIAAARHPAAARHEAADRRGRPSRPPRAPRRPGGARRPLPGRSRAARAARTAAVAGWPTSTTPRWRPAPGWSRRSMPLENLASPHGMAAISARLRAPDGCPWDRQPDAPHAAARTCSRRPTRRSTPSSTARRRTSPRSSATCCSRSSSTRSSPPRRVRST